MSKEVQDQVVELLLRRGCKFIEKNETMKTKRYGFHVVINESDSFDDTMSLLVDGFAQTFKVFHEIEASVDGKHFSILATVPDCSRVNL